MSWAAVCGVKISQTVRKLVATFVRPLGKRNFAIFSVLRSLTDRDIPAALDMSGFFGLRGFCNERLCH
jgi:hypothetical protein